MMPRKIENGAAVGLIVFLAVVPLVFKILQSLFFIQIPDAESIVVHVVFVYACLAGIITWRENRHLSLASFVERFPEPAQRIIVVIKNFFTAAVLTALFINAVCQLVHPAQFTTTVWHIPLRVFFLFLPCCYLMLMVISVRQQKVRVPAVAGIVVGALCASGPLAGILYFLFGWENLPLLHAVDGAWIAAAFAARWPFVIICGVLAFFGVPLFVVFAGIASVLLSGYVDVIPLETYRILSDRSNAAIPLFTIAGYILPHGSAGKRFVELFKSLFGWFRGGTVVAAVIVATFFSTFTGVSGVTILAL
ncbi:MAG: TRAP transporter large permease subunit, partial [Treponema sp.]|nr:TRAP transporter large permease subunit [Treponema sp.]